MFPIRRAGYVQGGGAKCSDVYNENLEVLYTKTKRCWPWSLIAGVIYRKLHIFYTAMKAFSWWAIQFVPLPWKLQLDRGWELTTEGPTVNNADCLLLLPDCKYSTWEIRMHDCEVMICSLPIVLKMNISALNVRFGVLMVVTVKIFILWDVMSCSLVKFTSISEECVGNSSTLKLK